MELWAGLILNAMKVAFLENLYEFEYYRKIIKKL
jgi:hypothetical protein